MYTPSYFNENDPEIIASILKQYSFATLVQAGPSIEATHVPVLCDFTAEKGVIKGHFAKMNPLAEMMKSAEESLVIFQGPHGYISPTWYQSQNQVPTWNYISVHVYGKPKIIEDSAWLISLLTELTDENESRLKSPWKFEPTEIQKQTLLKMIVGFEIEIDRIEAKFKLNQNRKPEERAGVIKALESLPTENNLEIAKWMKG